MTETALIYQKFQAHDTLERPFLCRLDDPKRITRRGHVSRNSEAGRASGIIIRVYTREFDRRQRAMQELKR